MAEPRYIIKHYDTDFLVIGGGIAGLMAAINAADKGMSCIVVEKSNTKRSGSGGLGNDHFICYIPEVHGEYEPFINEVLKLQNGARLRQMGMTWAKAFFGMTSKMVKLWDEWGIPMKHEGKYHFAGHAVPGRTRFFLKYYGKDQKLVLTREAKKRGVAIHNRQMGYELLKNAEGRIVGAIAVDTRDYVLHVYRAKAVCLGTGVAKVYAFPSRGTAGMTNTEPLTLTGDGRMMAFRAGAELCNIEMPYFHAGAKYFWRSGQATWEGVLRTSDGKPVGPFLDKPNPLYGEITMEVDKKIIARRNKEGRPVFMDMTGLTEDELNLMKTWLTQEGNTTLLAHVDKENINLMDTALEFSTYSMIVPPAAGISFNGKSETNVPGLYATGDEGYGGIAGACVTGWWAADAAAEYIKGLEHCDIDAYAPLINGTIDKLEALLNRENGAHWNEAFDAVMNVTRDYCGESRSEEMLEQGLEHLQRLEATSQKSLMAANPHELAYCLSVLNIYQFTKLIFIMSLDRKESRGYYQRCDYPLQNLMLDGKRHFIRKEKNQNIISWR